MERKARFILIALFLLAWLSGCATTAYQYTEPSYQAPPRPGSVLEQVSLDPSLEERILALNPERVTGRDVGEVLSRAPAPRIINIHGGRYPVYRAMISFSKFLIGMGYPEDRIRNPGDGSYSFSCYGSSEKIAGAIAWYYEREGLRPMMVGHSQGGMQAVKVLYQLNGTFGDEVRVWNPLTKETEERTSILDPFTGVQRPVVGIGVSYVSAVGAGGLTRLLPNQWIMTARLRSIPDTAAEFTGFTIPMDLLGGDLLGYGSANQYVADGVARVRNVRLPFGYSHGKVPMTAHLVESEEIKDWINHYIPEDKPELDVELKGDTHHILWAADVWCSVKRHWVLELQHLIMTKRKMTYAR